MGCSCPKYIFLHSSIWETPANFRPNQPRNHGSRPAQCTWTDRRTPGWGPRPDLTWTAPTKSWTFFYFCFRQFSQKRPIWAAWTARSTLWPPPSRGWWGGRGAGSKYLYDHDPKRITRLPRFRLIANDRPDLIYLFPLNHSQLFDCQKVLINTIDNYLQRLISCQRALPFGVDSMTFYWNKFLSTKVL